MSDLVITLSSSTLGARQLQSTTADLTDLLKKDRSNFRVGEPPVLERPQAHATPGMESKVDPVSLTAIGLAFLTTGAAKALISAIRSALPESKEADIEITVTPPQGEAIHFKGENLTGGQVDKVISMFDRITTPKPSPPDAAAGRA